MGVRNQITFLILYSISSRLVPLLEVTDAPIQVPNIFYLTVSFKFLNFRYLTKIGADIDIRNANKNNTALHLSDKSGSVDIIKLLLEKGMSVNMTDANVSTPLHVFAQFCHLDSTKTLVDKGAAINFTDSDDNTPLVVAAKNGKLNILPYLTNRL